MSWKTWPEEQAAAASFVSGAASVAALWVASTDKIPFGFVVLLAFAAIVFGVIAAIKVGEVS